MFLIFAKIFYTQAFSCSVVFSLSMREAIANSYPYGFMAWGFFFIILI